MKTSHFKIIGLRPTSPHIEDFKVCEKAQNIHKALVGIDEWLNVYEGYKVSGDYSCIQLSSLKQRLDYSLYDTDYLKVTVGAIVGRNGAGKSSFVELLVRVINNLTAALLGEGYNFAKAEHLHYIDNVYADLLVQIGNKFLIISVKGRRISLLWYKRSADSTYRYDRYHSEDILDDGELKNNSNEILKGHSKGRLILRQLFYTLVFNYSLYGFNYRDFDKEETPSERLENIKIIAKNNVEDEQVSWLSGIFHKNDGYQTPIVLHPLRQDGQLNIIKENRLAKERLLSLLFYKDSDGNFPFRIINEKLTVEKIKISLAPRRYSKENMLETLCIKKTQNLAKYFDGIYDVILQFWDSNFDISKAHASKYYKDACDYIVYKTLKIVHSYKKYNSIFRYLSQSKFDKDCLLEMLCQLLDDYTHITRKLRQTINFLINPVFDVANDEIDLKNFKNIPEQDQKYKLFLSNDSVNYLPPPIFNTDLILSRPLFDADFPYMYVPFSGLSSGERQIAYTISNILYHLTNIDSEWDDTFRWKDKRSIIKYKFVNIILDEVELYFHPEMQRQFVFLLLHAIRCVKFRHLKGIHILFATHSPFILSDIPSDHVLALGLRNEKDKEEPIKTFGANIMEMLSNTFFMDSSIGETVRREISKLVEYHIDIVRNGNIHNDDFLGERNRFKYVCENIGDDFFKKICSRMLNEIEAQIKNLQ